VFRGGKWNTLPSKNIWVGDLVLINENGRCAL
jgi:hypothetical protein